MRMLKVTILDTELEADLLNPKVVKRYSEEIDKVVEKVNDAEEKGIEERINDQCKAVVELIDHIFGEESSKKVLGEETDLLTCLQAYWEITRIYKDQVIPYMDGEIAKMRAGED